jgi:hypothetical protein
MTIQDHKGKASDLRTLKVALDFALYVEPEEQKRLDEGYENLVEIAEQHISEARLHVPITNFYVWAVHPCCAELDYEKRPRQIARFLDYIKKSKSQPGRILVSYAIDYVIKEHILIEKNNFDYVILTKSSSGICWDPSELRAFDTSTQNLVGGCYLGMCVDKFADSLVESMPLADTRISGKWSCEQRKTVADKLYKAAYNAVPNVISKNLPAPRDNIIRNKLENIAQQVGFEVFIP